MSFPEGAAAAFEPKRQSHLVWSPFAADTTSFEPSAKPFMINFHVHYPSAFLTQLRGAGVGGDEKTDETEFGKFGWINPGRQPDRTVGTAAE
ncbi:MAG: hypothetical protein ABI946_11815 [Chthoniobacterales bacterium]